MEKQKRPTGRSRRRRRRRRSVGCVAILLAVLLPAGIAVYCRRAELGNWLSAAGSPSDSGAEESTITTGASGTPSQPTNSSSDRSHTGESTKKPTSSAAITTTGTTGTPVNQAGKRVLADVPVLSQFPDFPTGCESVSAVIAMRYAGDQISVDTFVDDYLETSEDFYTSDGISYGPDPSVIFAGTPRNSSSYGCMAPVIEKAMNRYYQGRKTVVNATGTSLKNLCRTYIDRGIPCLVWVTIGMVDAYYTSSWTLPDGTNYRWLANEHCMVLIGYDDSYYYFSDPYRGKQLKYQQWICEDRYKRIGQQALAITD